jgi:hypothetical protein
MLTRRDMMLGLSAAAAFQSSARATPTLQIDTESHCLSEESASGYQLLMNEGLRIGPSNTLLIAPAARELTLGRCRRLLELVEHGAWLLLEAGVCFSCSSDAASQAVLVQKVFGILPLPPIVIGREAVTHYVDFSWPASQLVRAFHAVVPVAPGDHQVIARFQGYEACVRKPIAKGGIVYLGTMLGPGLLAGEREVGQLFHELSRFA